MEVLVCLGSRRALVVALPRPRTAKRSSLRRIQAARPAAAWIWRRAQKNVGPETALLQCPSGP
eukprot:4673120-Lingulodinium_polyedra.AAC.1